MNDGSIDPVDLAELGAQEPVVAPGWYRDPNRPNVNRYWDGHSWTDAVAKAPATPTAPTPKDPSALIGFGYVTALFLPIVGFVLAIIILARGYTSHGVATLVISILAMVIAVNAAL